MQNNPIHAGPGDFDFLSGHWHIANRRLVANEWDSFEGEASVIALLGGTVSVEELRIPARNFSGMGLRLFDRTTQRWADYWVNSAAGVLPAQPTWGGFYNGVGIWDSEEEDGSGALILRGVWDSITPDSCRWHQTVSRDGGASWAEQWVMQWTRATGT